MQTSGAAARDAMHLPLSPNAPHPAAHSDPDALRAAAEEARAGAEAGSAEFLEKRAKVAALLEAMRGEPSEAELMQVCLAGAGGGHGLG